GCSFTSGVSTGANDGDWEIIATQQAPGQTASEAATLTLTLDTVAPGAVVLASDTSSLVNGTDTTITATVTEAATLAVDDFTVTGGTLKSFTQVVGSDTEYTVVFTAVNATTSEITATILVAANTFTDIAGNDNNAASNTLSITVPGATMPIISIVDANVAEADAPGALSYLEFEVMLAPTSSSEVTFDYASMDGTAEAATDYNAASGSLTFAAGASTLTITVTVVGDNVDENDETVLLELSNAVPANAFPMSATTRTATGTINDTDPVPTLQIATTDDLSQREGNDVANATDAAEWLVSVAPVTPGSVTDFTLTAGVRFDQVPPNCANVLEGDGTSMTAAMNGDQMFASGAGSFTVTSNPDTVDNTADCVVTITLSLTTGETNYNISNTASMLTLTITEDDTPTAAPMVDVPVNNSFVIAASTNQTVYPVSGTANAGEVINITVTDSAPTAVTVNASVTTDTGGAWATTVDISSLAEGALTFGITATDSFFPTSMPVMRTVTKDTMVPTVTTSGDNAAQVGDTVTVTFMLSDAPAGSTDFVVGDLSAVGGTLGALMTTSDTSYSVVFTATTANANGGITIAENAFTDAAGNPSAMTVHTINVSAVVTYTIASATGTPNVSADEGDAMEFVITRSEMVSDTAVSLTYEVDVEGITTNFASADDFAGGIFPSGTAMIAVGETEVTVTITANDDTNVEPDETFNFKASLNGTQFNSVEGTITNDDDFTYTIANVSALEGDAMAFEIVRSEAAAGTPVSLNWAVEADTDRTNEADAADFGGTFPSGTAMIAVGANTVTVMVTANDDDTDETDETFNFVVTVASTGVIATGTIENDDAPSTAPVFSMSVANAYVNADNVNAFMVSGTATTGAAISVTVTDSAASPNTGTVTETATATAGSWSVTLDLGILEEGTLTIEATALEMNRTPTTATVAVSKDTMAPTITLTAESTSLAAGASTTITVTVSEAVADLETGDIVVSDGGSLGALALVSGSTTVYTATFTAVSRANALTVSLTVAAGAYTDVASNPGAATVGALDIAVAAQLALAQQPSIELTAGSDTGISTDNITSDGEPVFTIGNLQTDATITVEATYTMTGGTVVGKRKTFTALSAIMNVQFGTPGAGGNCDLFDGTTGTASQTNQTACALHVAGTNEAFGIHTIDATQSIDGRIDNSADSFMFTIQADPPRPVISISAGGDVMEGDGATTTANAIFTLTSNVAATADDPLAIEVLISQVGDYISDTDAMRRQLNIASSATTVTFNIAIVNDNLDEADGRVTATIQMGTGYSVSTTSSAATVTVADDDLPVISIAAADSSVTEAEFAVFVVATNVTARADLPVGIAVTQTGNYIAGGDVATHSVTIANGKATATLSIAIDDDMNNEPSGTVTGTVAADTTGTIYDVHGMNNSAVITVADNDVPSVSIAIGGTSSSVKEGVGAVFTVSVTPPPAAALSVPVGVVVSADFATSATLPTSVMLTSANTSVMFTIATEDDLVDEDDGTIVATLESGGTGYNRHQSDNVATYTVLDDDTPGLTITADPVTVSEGTSNASYTITASIEPRAPLVVALTVSEQGGSNFVLAINEGAKTPTLRFAESAPYIATYNVPMRNDDDNVADGTVTVTLSSAPMGQDYTVSTVNNSAVVNVTDDDTATPFIGASTPTANTVVNAASAITLTVAGTATTGATIRIDVTGGGTFNSGNPVMTTATGGNWTADLNLLSPTRLSDGTLTIRVTASETGKTESSAATRNVMLDATVPTVTIAAASPTLKVGTSTMVTFTF
ncbi:MAG: Ig-like domain-containing protein, partial [Pseudohongiellaceae bacterium]